MDRAQQITENHRELDKVQDGTSNKSMKMVKRIIPHIMNKLFISWKF